MSKMTAKLWLILVESCASGVIDKTTLLCKDQARAVFAIEDDDHSN